MDILLTLANATACGMIFFALVGAILSPRVHDGIVIKAGLICMALGFGSIMLSLADGSAIGDGQRLVRALLLIHAGIAVVILGYIHRSHRENHPLRRKPDWVKS